MRVAPFLLGWVDVVGEGDDVGRGKKYFNGLGGVIGWVRTFRCRLKLLNARFAWGTYLFAYEIFSEYRPLAKNRIKVVTETSHSPGMM